MKCPLCDGRMIVNTTRHKQGITRRYRECVECLTQYTTSEKINFHELDPYILKKLLERKERNGR